MKKFIHAAIAAAVVGASAGASATVITLDFEGVGSQAMIHDFYNGGSDSDGNSGVNYGVHFGDSAIALKASDPDANIARLPSPETGMIFLSSAAVLNFASGFYTGFSFYYSTVADPATVEVWSEVNATGTRLGVISLRALGSGPVSGDPFSNWDVGSLAFSGRAKSITFGGTTNHVVYDDITFGSTSPGTNRTPEPATLGLAGLALAGLAAARRRH